MGRQHVDVLGDGSRRLEVEVEVPVWVESGEAAFGFGTAEPFGADGAGEFEAGRETDRFGAFGRGGGAG